MARTFACLSPDPEPPCPCDNKMRQSGMAASAPTILSVAAAQRGFISQPELGGTQRQDVFAGHQSDNRRRPLRSPTIDANSVECRSGAICHPFPQDLRRDWLSSPDSLGERMSGCGVASATRRLSCRLRLPPHHSDHQPQHFPAPPRNVEPRDPERQCCSGVLLVPAQLKSRPRPDNPSSHGSPSQLS